MMRKKIIADVKKKKGRKREQGFDVLNKGDEWVRLTRGNSVERRKKQKL